MYKQINTNVYYEVCNDSRVIQLCNTYKTAEAIAEAVRNECHYNNINIVKVERTTYRK